MGLNRHGMPQRQEPQELQLFLSRLRQQRHLLPVPQLSFVLQAVARLLFPELRRANLRPQLPSLRQSLEALTSRDNH